MASVFLTIVAFTVETSTEAISDRRDVKLGLDSFQGAWIVVHSERNDGNPTFDGGTEFRIQDSSIEWTSPFGGRESGQLRLITVSKNHVLFEIYQVIVDSETERESEVTLLMGKCRFRIDGEPHIDVMDWKLSGGSLAPRTQHIDSDKGRYIAKNASARFILFKSRRDRELRMRVR